MFQERHTLNPAKKKKKSEQQEADTAVAKQGRRTR